MAQFDKLSTIIIKLESYHFIWVALYIITFISVFSLSGTVPVFIGIEPSWMAVLEHAAKYDFQFGKDIVFTHGPLGFLNAEYGMGLLITQRILFAFAWCGIIAWSVIFLARKMPRPSRYVFIIWVLVFSNTYYGSMDLYDYLVMTYGCSVLMDNMLSRKTEVVIFLFTIALLSLIKFTFFIASVSGLVICCILHVCKGNIKHAAMLFALFGTFVLSIWLAAGQQPVNIFSWIRNSYEITAGYTEAMSIMPAQSVFLAILIALFLFLIAVTIRAMSMKFNIENICFLMVTVLYVFLSWKQGFVRADDYHTFNFILFLPIGFSLLLVEQCNVPMSRKVKTSLNFLFTGVIMLCSLAADYQLTGKIYDDFTSYPEHLLENARLILKAPVGECTKRYLPTIRISQQEQAFLDKFTVPREIIGDAPVDAISNVQIVALTNNLNYRPRPVIQSYSAYTPYLQDLNLSFFRSENRPAYILFSLETIDGRFPMLDDAAALPYILKNYELIWQDEFILLLKSRQQKTQDLHLKKINEQVITFGEHINLSKWEHSAVLMRVDIKPTIAGRIMRFFFRPQVLYLHTSMPGRTKDFRFVPGMASRGFILNPLLQNNSDVVRMYQKAGERIENLYFTKSDSFWEEYANSITVQLYEYK